MYSDMLKYTMVLSQNEGSVFPDAFIHLLSMFIRHYGLWILVIF